MDKKMENYLRLMELVRQEEQYGKFMEEYAQLNRRLVQAMDSMEENEKSAVEDYLGFITQFDNFLLLFSCENMEFPGQ